MPVIVYVLLLLGAAVLALVAGFAVAYVIFMRQEVRA